jgi:cystathionine beta-synthase
MYDDSWMAENGFLETRRERSVAGDLLALLGREGKLIYLLPDDSLKQAAEIFREQGISQLPVVEEGKMVGAVQEITIIHALHNGTSDAVRLRAIMARPMPQVDSSVLLDEVYRLLLAGNPAVVVVNEGQLSGLVTRADLIEYYERSGRQDDQQK